MTKVVRSALMLAIVCSLFGALVRPAPAYAAAGFNCWSLETGIYWFGLGNTSQKSDPGVANPYYNPARPTVIYVHGWEKDTSQRQFRETFNYRLNDTDYGVDINTADSWINAGWNIGIFYWNQFSDEGEVKDAEAKIWTPSGPQGMRWRKCDGSYVAGGATVSAAQLFYNAYTAALANYTGSNIRVVGHSLGNQMATRLTKMVSDNITAGRIPARLLPTRVALLDPFWSQGGKDYLGGRWTGEVARDHVRELIGKGVIFERTKTSNINDFFIGDSNAGMTAMMGMTEIVPAYIPNTSQGNRHVAAPNLYFWSFGTAAPAECVNDSWGICNNSGLQAESAATSDSRTRTMMSSTYNWYQVSGTSSATPGDNRYQRTNR